MNGNYKFRHRLRVRYQETDQMGVVYHANYLNWFEIGRTEWIRALGTPYTCLEETGLLLPVTDLQIRYVHPARYDDEVEVLVHLAECSFVRIAFDYEIRRANDQELLVSGTTTHVWVNRSWKPVRFDKAMPELYETIRAQLQAREG